MKAKYLIIGVMLVACGCSDNFEPYEIRVDDVEVDSYQERTGNYRWYIRKTRDITEYEYYWSYRKIGDPTAPWSHTYGKRRENLGYRKGEKYYRYGPSLLYSSRSRKEAEEKESIFLKLIPLEEEKERWKKHGIMKDIK